MVWQRPFFIGKPGCVRSNACTCAFSSTHSTTALSGGFRYTPTTSVSFSTNRLSLDNLNVSIRWGFRPCASHIRCTVDLPTPFALAIERTDQCVASRGIVWRVASTMAFTRPVGREVDRQAAIALFDRPSAANRQMRARRTVRWGLVLARPQASSVVRCSFVIFRGFAFSHMPQTITRWGGIVKILLGHYTSMFSEYRWIRFMCEYFL